MTLIDLMVLLFGFILIMVLTAVASVLIVAIFLILFNGISNLLNKRPFLYIEEDVFLSKEEE